MIWLIISIVSALLAGICFGIAAAPWYWRTL